MIQYKRIIGTICLGAALLTLSGCGGALAETKPVQKQIFAMDTVMDLTAYGSNGEKALEAAVQEINQIGGELDPEQTGSAVNRMNAHETVELTPLMQDMVETAGTVYTQSGGALDLTVYPVVKAWGFIDQEYRIPEQTEIDGALATKNFPGIQMEETDGKTYMTLPENTEISFGAVAKGATANAVIDTLRENGVTSALISLGGNIQTLGQKPDGSNWNVAVQDPENLTDYLGVLSVGETAVVTSGSYQRYFEQDGKIYHHIINPATGYPAESGLTAVTIVCTDGAMADSLSTAMFVLGQDKALDYWKTYGGFEMILVREDGTVVLTPGLKDCFTGKGDRYTFVYAEE